MTIKKYLSCIALLLTVFLTYPVQSQTEPKTGFVPLFDGSTLSGWSGDSKLWSVKEGAITGSSNNPITDNSFLIYDKKYSNFEIQLKYRFLTAQGNSGLQYRSQVIDGAKFLVKGYQANIVPKEEGERYAFLWEENGRELLANLTENVELGEKDGLMNRQVKGLVASEKTILIADKPYPEWNKLVVIARDNKLIHMINGHKAVEVVDNDQTRRSMEGLIALQLHSGPSMTIQIKDIFIKEFPMKPQTLKLENMDMGGKALFEEKCSVCHNSGLPGFITVSDLSKFPQQRIIDTLLHGVMKPQAIGMSEIEAKDIAEYLTMKK